MIILSAAPRSIIDIGWINSAKRHTSVLVIA